MFPGLMAVKFNLFALPVVKGEEKQDLLRPRCPQWPAIVPRDG